jgi:hypothetical protein
MPMRFNPQTGQPCDLPVERVVVRQSPPRMSHGSIPPQSVTPPEDNAREAAWQLEHEAMLAPTATRSGTALGASLKPALAQLVPSCPDRILRRERFHYTRNWRRRRA